MKLKRRGRKVKQTDEIYFSQRKRAWFFVTPEDTKETNHSKWNRLSGEYPYTKRYTSQHVSLEIWTMRQFAGFGTPRRQNQRFKYLLAHRTNRIVYCVWYTDINGMGCWCTDIWKGEVRICGLNFISFYMGNTFLMEFPLDQVSTSMTINSPILWFMHFILLLPKTRHSIFRN